MCFGVRVSKNPAELLCLQICPIPTFLLGYFLLVFTEHLTGFLLLARHVIVDVQHAAKCVRKWSSAGFHRSAISWRHESQNNETDNDLSDKNAITHCEFKLKTMKYYLRSINDPPSGTYGSH